MATADIDLGPIHVGSVRRLRFEFKKDGDLWSGIDSITMTFEKPDRSTQFSVAMVLESDANAIWYYDLTKSTIDVADRWTVGFQVIDGTIDIKYPFEVSFQVTQQP